MSRSSRWRRGTQGEGDGPRGFTDALLSRPKDLCPCLGAGLGGCGTYNKEKMLPVYICEDEENVRGIQRECLEKRIMIAG